MTLSEVTCDDIQSWGDKLSKSKELLFIYRNNILWDRITIKAQDFVYTKESNK